MIYFHTEGIRFRVQRSRKIRTWIKNVIQTEGKVAGNINFIFCADEFLAEMNSRYLHHHTYTDVITFDYSQDSQTVEGDIYISVERVADNAEKRHLPFEEELHRVMIHGVLHLLGYTDKQPATRRRMRKKENECLSML
ncbi:MAG: endoribonuclease YbeY [Chitinophagales bacterium]|nr:MAG: endoribonuclease YbeY [Chitinophagales bacterium]